MESTSAEIVIDPNARQSLNNFLQSQGWVGDFLYSYHQVLQEDQPILWEVQVYGMQSLH
jgi:hypothetical protein